MKTQVKRSYLKNNFPLSGRDRKLFVSCCEEVALPAKSYIGNEDVWGDSYLFILLDGMVREYSVEQNRECAHAFYCENDFFGRRDPAYSCEIRYQAMEPVMLYRIKWKDWAVLQQMSPSIRQLWLTWMERQAFNCIHWETMFYSASVHEMFATLQRHKPAILRKARLNLVLEHMCHE